MKPILFNTEMVRAILEGRKTVTRRVVARGKSNPKYHGRDKFYGIVDHLNNDYKNWYAGFYNDSDIFYGVNGERLIDAIYFKAPYKVGDFLYVRETWRWLPCFECGRDMWAIPCREGKFNHKYGNCGCYVFKADIHNCDTGFFKWKPCLHMPKEAARIFLRVTGVRVERLQDMSHDDCIKEGILANNNRFPAFILDDFAELWNSTIKKGEHKYYGWMVNPYVWVIEFEVIDGSSIKEVSI